MVFVEHKYQEVRECYQNRTNSCIRIKMNVITKITKSCLILSKLEQMLVGQTKSNI